MTLEDRKLLFKDICSRLPYDVCGEGEYEEEADYEHPLGRLERSVGHIDGIDHIGFDDGEIYVTIEGIPCELSTVKLYLRPMETMTMTEVLEFEKITNGFLENGSSEELWDVVVDWMNEHHLDHRHMIEKGLALPPTHSMYVKFGWMDTKVVSVEHKDKL